MSRNAGGACTVYTCAMSVRFSIRETWLPARRALAVLAAVVLLHVLAFDWADRNIEVLRMTDRQPLPIAEVELRPPPAPPPESAPAKKPFKPKPKPRPQHVAPPAPEPAMAADAPDARPDGSDTAAPAAAGGATPKAAAEAGAPAPEVKNTGKDEGASIGQSDEDKSAPVRYKLEFPPSAELKYDVQRVPAGGGNPWYGSGTIDWQHSGDKYQVAGETRFLLFKPLKFTSEGSIDGYGIAPVLYSEKRFNRSETATHFNRDQRGNISFSASQSTYQIKGGEQDLGSAIWEIAAIGRGDRERFVPGAQIDLLVAGSRDADIWSILVVGQEEIEIDHNKTQAWHVARIPPAGSHGRKIDIWLAPQDQWYPVRILQTESSGEYYDMTMTSVSTLPDQVAR
jgi:hypothetical protein